MLRYRGSVAGWFFVLALAGCTPHYGGVGAPTLFREPALPEQALETNERESPAVEPALVADSSTEAGSDVIAIGLPQTIRLSMLVDPRIQAALQSVEQARADYTTAGLLPNPMLRGSQTLNPLPGSPFNARTGQGGPPQFDIGIAYSVDTLIFGKRSAAMEAARLGVDVALAEYSDVARQRVLEAITAYYDVLQSRELLRLAREEVEQIGRLQTITERRLALGSVGQIEAERIRVALIAGRRRLVEAEAEFDNSLSRFRARLGQAHGAERADAAGTLEFAVPQPAPELASALAVAEEHRPDFVAVRRQTTRVRADLTRERRAAWPTLNLAAGYTRQFQQQAIGFPDASSWGAGLEMSLPIFDRNQGNIRRAESSIVQADRLVEAARIDLRAEVVQALRSYRSAYQIVTTVAQALRGAASTRQRIGEAYSLGGRTLLEVLDAQTSYREVFREYTMARAEFLRSLHRLNAVVGTEMIHR